MNHKRSLEELNFLNPRKWNSKHLLQ